jgi:hypothetical protein
MPISRAFFYISFRTPVKEPSVHVLLAELPQIDAPFPELSFTVSLSPQ